MNEVYKQYMISRLMCQNCSCKNELMAFLKQQQSLKPEGETVYPNDTINASSMINNQEDLIHCSKSNNQQPHGDTNNEWWHQ